MMFSPLGLVLGAALSQNVEDQQKRTEIQLLGGMFGSSPMGMVILASIARQPDPSRTPLGAGPPTESEVPDVTGHDVGTVAVLVESRGLVVMGTEKAISDKAIGTIITIKPPPGTVVDRGAGVTIVVSAGLQVPDVVGQNLDSAKNELSLIGFESSLGSPTEITPDAPAGTVTAQDPSAGSFATKGHTVLLTVAGDIVATARRTSTKP